MLPSSCGAAPAARLSALHGPLRPEDDEGGWEYLAGLYCTHQRIWPVITAALNHLML